jgi:heme oxygenase
MDNSITLHQQLKNQTVELHKQAQKVPYVAHFLKNNFPLLSYIGHLRGLAIIYGTLENQLKSSECQEIKGFLKNYTPKLDLILSDLAFLNANKEKDIMPAVSQALHIADNILLYSITNPYKLLGYIYTLEGSLNGGSVLKKHVSETFNFQNNDATKYLSCADERFKIFWEGFIHKLNSHITENQIKEDIAAAAGEIFVDLTKIYEALFPIDEKSLKSHITSLNPEAGNYPIPTNPLEIKAAITAGMKCWDEFPYYEIRYGDRGRRFAVSDSVWLVNLGELSEEGAIKQASWLANFLAIRGMPTFTMEKQLQYLYIELTKLIPANESKYLTLLKTSQKIKSRRYIHFSENSFCEANSLFENYFTELKVSEKKCEELKKNIGKLIASSIADDKNGIPEAKTSLKEWLQNKEIFPTNWILAIEKTYIDIESLVRLK